MTLSYSKFVARLFLFLFLFALAALPASAIPVFELYGDTEGGFVRIQSGDATPNDEEQTIGPFDILTDAAFRAKRFRIRNGGDQTLRINFPQISDAIDHGFVVRDFPATPQTLAELAPGQSFIFRIELTPKKQTAISTLIIPHNGAGSGGANFVAIIKGEANAGEASFLYSPVDGNGEVAIANGDGTPTPTEGTSFGAVDIGRPIGQDPHTFNPSVVHRFVLRNRSTEGDTLYTRSPEILDSEGNTSPHFQITNYNSTNPAAPLSSDSLDLFEITFNPTSTGLHVATFTVTTSDLDDRTYTFTLIGRGTSSSRIRIEGAPDVNSPFREVIDGSTAPSPFNGTILPVSSVGDTSSRSFKILSIGSNSLQILEPPSSSNPDFYIDELSITTLLNDPTRPLSLNVNFQPTERGIVTSVITVRTDDPLNPDYTFTIIANGTASELVAQGRGSDGKLRDIPNDPEVPPSTEYGTLLGTIESDAAPITREFTIRNHGNEAAEITNLFLSGTHQADFSLSGLDADGQQSEILEANSSTTFTLTFTPSSVGVRNSIIVIEQRRNSQTESYSFPVSATVQGSGKIQLQGRPASGSAFRNISPGDSQPTPGDGTQFPDTAAGESNSSTFRIVNSGTDILRITSIIIRGSAREDFQIQPIPTGNLQPGGTSTFNIHFTPSQETLRTVSILISSDDPTQSTFVFAIEGTGLEAESSLPATRVQDLTFDGNDAVITYLAEPGKSFVLKTSTTLAKGSWALFPDLEQIDGQAGEQTLRLENFKNTTKFPHRFFRLEEVEAP